MLALPFYFFLLFVLPLVYSTSFASTFEHPKVLFFRVLVFMFSLYFLVVRRRVRKLTFDFWDYLALFWLVVVSASSLRAGNFAYSFWGGFPRYQGILTQACLILLFIISRMVFVESGETARRVKNFFIYSSILQTLILAIQWWQVNILKMAISTYAGRVVGTFGQPNTAAGFLAVGFALSLGMFLKERKRLFLVLALVIFAGILSTYSQGAFAAVLFAFLIGTLRQSRNKVVKNILAATFVLSLTFGMVYMVRQERINYTIAGVSRIESRFSIWPQSWKLFTQRPLIGYGAENLGRVFPDAFGGSTVDRAHNALLDALLLGGVFAGVIYITFAVGGLIRSLSVQSLFPESLALIAILTQDMVNVPSIVNLITFWLILALVFSEQKPPS